jgi:hypothetical protein
VVDHSLDLAVDLTETSLIRGPLSESLGRQLLAFFLIGLHVLGDGFGVLHFSFQRGHDQLLDGVEVEALGIRATSAFSAPAVASSARMRRPNWQERPARETLTGVQWR